MNECRVNLDSLFQPVINVIFLMMHLVFIMETTRYTKSKSTDYLIMETLEEEHLVFLLLTKEKRRFCKFITKRPPPFPTEGAGTCPYTFSHKRTCGVLTNHATLGANPTRQSS